MKHLNLIAISILFFSCQKECLPPPEPCTPSYFADVTMTEKQGFEYSLMIGNNPVDTWKGDTTSTGRSIDVSIYYTGEPLEFRIRQFGGGLYAWSDVYRDSVRVPSAKLYQLPSQSGSGSLWVHREGGLNKITARNSLYCQSEARLTYNGKDTLLTLAAKPAGTEGGTDYVFYTTDSVFNISFQLLTPCEYWSNHDVMRVSSSSIKEFDAEVKIGVRKEDCENIKK